MDIYEYTSIIKYLKNYIENSKLNKKKGEHANISSAAQIQASYLSQILKGDRFLNLDQGLLLARYFKLNPLDTRYFLLLVNLERAQSTDTIKYLNSEIQKLRAEKQQISKKISAEEVKFNTEDMAQFYSSILYSLVRTLPALGYCDLESISNKLGVDPLKVQNIIQFLVRSGMLAYDDKKKLKLSTAHIHLAHNSPFISSLHSNSRRLAMDYHPTMDPNTDLAYSGFLTLSRDDAFRIRDLILTAIKDVKQISDPSSAKELYLFNVDWINII